MLIVGPHLCRCASNGQVTFTRSTSETTERTADMYLYIVISRWASSIKIPSHNPVDTVTADNYS
jgi:hypothetical protein